MFQLSGLVVGGIGIWTVISKHSYVSLMTTSTYPALAYALIVAGVLAVVGSWLGCGGVTSENRCVLLIVSNRWDYSAASPRRVPLFRLDPPPPVSADLTMNSFSSFFSLRLFQQACDNEHCIPVKKLSIIFIFKLIHNFEVLF